jgi:hypothetical protein
MRQLGGRCQRAVRRCLWVNGTATTAQILEWAYRWPGRDRRTRKEPRASCVPCGWEDGGRGRSGVARRHVAVQG